MASIEHVPKSQLHAGPGFNIFHVPSLRRQFEEQTVVLDRSQMSKAAEALREAEVEAQERATATASLTQNALEAMNIDELRRLAKQLAIPDREKIVEKEELIAAVRRCL